MLFYNLNNDWNNLGTLTGEESLLSKVTEEDKSINHPPSSPEDGEITDDDSIEENNEKVKFTIKINLVYFFILIILHKTTVTFTVHSLSFKMYFVYYSK